MEKRTVTIEVSPLMERLAHSPLLFVLGALSGVGCSFAPWALYDFGRLQLPWYHPVLLVTFALVYTLAWFGVMYGMQVLWRVRGEGARASPEGDG